MRQCSYELGKIVNKCWLFYYIIEQDFGNFGVRGWLDAFPGVVQKSFPEDVIYCLLDSTVSQN